MGLDVDIWSADSGGGAAAPSSLHLHHPGGLPRTPHLPPLCGALESSQRSLHQVVEGKGQ